MSMFTLIISCLTTSNLPWFMDLTFKVPMQYCSLQHWTLLPSPVTSTIRCCFCFGSISSFFLELFLYQSPVAYWAPTNWGVHLSVSYPFAFSYCLWGSKGKNTEVVILDCACPIQLLETKQAKAKKKKSGKLFKYPNCFWCIVIICLHVSSIPCDLPSWRDYDSNSLLYNYCVFHLDVVNHKLFSFFFATCRLKTNKYPLSTSYIIKTQLLKLHNINLLCDLQQESKLLFFHTAS